MHLLFGIVLYLFFKNREKLQNRYWSENNTYFKKQRLCEYNNLTVQVEGDGIYEKFWILFWICLCSSYLPQLRQLTLIFLLDLTSALWGDMNDTEKGSIHQKYLIKLVLEMGIVFGRKEETFLEE